MHKRQKKTIWVVALCLLWAAPIFARFNEIPWQYDRQIKLSAEQEAYYQELVQRGIEKEIWNSRYWKILMHYKFSIFGAESEVDSVNFFADPENGQTDMQAEFKATVRLFFAPEAADVKLPDGHNPGDAHPQCRFIARYNYLKQELKFDSTRLPEYECKRFDKWYAGMNPQSVSVVFSSYYFGNAASMMGHTLLKINRNKEKFELLDYGVNYAAVVPEEVNMISYVFLGLFGGFPGEFAIFPYYYKVNEYNNLEARDLWEYKLTLTKEEIRRMMYHLWELGPNFFLYYFTYENCSYHILSVLESARPSMRLTDPFVLDVQPADTIRVIHDQPGLVESIQFRPSQLTKYHNLFNDLSDAEKKVLYALVEQDDIEPIIQNELGEDNQRARVLDALIEYYSYVDAKEEALKGVQKKKYSKSLQLRTKYQYENKNLDKKPESAVPPHLTHKTHQVMFGGGNIEGQGAALLTLRPTLRELTDRHLGYLTWSQFRFFELNLSYAPELDPVPKLEKFTIIQITSLNPIRPLLFGYSWKIDLATENRRHEQGIDYSEDKHTTYFRLGIGGTFEFGSWAFLNNMALYTMVAAQVDLGSSLPNTVRLGPVAEGGLLLRFHPNVNLLIGGENRFYLLGQSKMLPIATSKLTLHLARDWAFQINYGYYADSSEHDVAGMFKYYTF